LIKGEEDWGEQEPWLWGWKRYATSKVLMIMFTFVYPFIYTNSSCYSSKVNALTPSSPCRYELQRRLAASPTLSNISVLAFEPAIVGGTGMVRTVPLQIHYFLRIVSYI
jgi:hypothetical protein